MLLGLNIWKRGFLFEDEVDRMLLIIDKVKSLFLNAYVVIPLFLFTFIILI